MGTYARQRAESSQAFFAVGQKLEIAVIKYVMTEKYVPKKWRYMIGRDVIDTALKMMNNIVEANSVYCNTEEKLIYRTALQDRAIANVKQLDHKIGVLLRVIDTVTADSIKDISALIFEERENLQKWKKTNKLTGK